MEKSRGTVGAWGAAAGHWERQAWIVGLLAAELGVALDEQSLLFYDVRDLLALRQRLLHELGRASRPHATPDWRRRLTRLWPTTAR